MKLIYSKISEKCKTPRMDRRSIYYPRNIRLRREPHDPLTHGKSARRVWLPKFWLHHEPRLHRDKLHLPPGHDGLLCDDNNVHK